MKRIAVLALAFTLTACTSSLLTKINRVTTNDARDATAINNDPFVPDVIGDLCVTFIVAVQPDIDRVLRYPTSGVLSVVAKRRAIENLKTKLRPEFEVACAPVLMDERQRFVRFTALFGR